MQNGLAREAVCGRGALLIYPRSILLPIDRLLDAFRTAVNVEEDMVGSLVVQKLVQPFSGLSGSLDDTKKA